MERKPSVVGSIVERKPTSSQPPPKPFSSGKTGFPTVQHRSKSAFARNREESRKNGLIKSQDVPIVQPSANVAPLRNPLPPDADVWREQISKENEQRVAHMTEEEREQERKEILERFGANVGDLLRRARLARNKPREGNVAPQPLVMDTRQTSEGSIPITTEERKPMPERVASPPPSALVSPGTSRPPSRADRKLRFAELEPEDVHVYDKAPVSPTARREALALPPPHPDSDAISLGKWHGKLVSSPTISLEPEPPKEKPEEPEEGSAEYIRQHFFPFAPKDEPSLAWMSVDLDSSQSSSIRFDLHGNTIPSALSLKLPTHLGLHHHADGARAGYTLDDIFLLSRSTVPAQRAMMLGILARITQRLGRVKKGEVDSMEELVGQEDDLRKRILAAGVAAMSEKGSLGPLAIEVLWECVVGWNPELVNVEGIELDSPADSIIETLASKHLLLQIVTLINQGGIPPESSNQLLSVLHRLAQQSNDIAEKLVSTPHLLPTVLQTFLLTPIPPQESSPLPNPLALRLFYTLAQSSRTNAEEIEKLGDSLLRFVTFSPFSSPFPPSLAIDLLTGTLNVYRALATYGLYSHVAGTAQSQFGEVERYAISEACHSDDLVVAWSNLVEAWTICATDPHQTTPPHDILWTQITSWMWHESVFELQSHLDSAEKDWRQWNASWRVHAAWLEGSKVNGIKGGDSERSDFIESVKTGFAEGTESKVVAGVVKALQTGLDGYKVGDVEQFLTLADCTDVLGSVIRLWLACIAPHTKGPPTSPPFSLPYLQISEVARKLLVHPLWSTIASPNTPTGYLHGRKLSGFLSYYLRLSQRLPDISQSLWVAQAFTILLRLLPGDESIALDIVKDIVTLVTEEWTTSRDIETSAALWKSGGLSILEPFFSKIIRPQEDVRIAPLTLTSQSMKAATTERLPPTGTLKDSGLLLNKDWTLAPLDHLLRSGDSAVFKALPISWDASETEVVRASLLLTKIAQAALSNFSMSDFVLTREGAEFGCMKIFMLEHGQPQNDSTEEVFRDDIVYRFMEHVLQPYEWGTVNALTATQGNLEETAVRFLGPSVPFFQFYTDLVELYDAISFSHPLFSRLLLTPTSMRYPIDYRKHLWSDFNHVVRTIHVSPEHVLSADIREYLYPLETEPQVIASYLSSILKDKIRDFVKVVAIHHVASNIWPDLQELGSKNEERSSVLFKAVVTQGAIDVVRQVVRYRQVTTGNVLLPPLCFEGLSSEASASRLDCILRWGGQTMVDKLRALLK